MMTFESDIATNIRTIPIGTPDQLDEWYAEQQDWANYYEAMYNPDDPYGYLG